MPLDVNLITSLVGWVRLVRRCIGQQGLIDLVELYSGFCRQSQALKVLIAHISAMVEDDPGPGPEAPLGHLQLMHQLHGILTGCRPIADIPIVPWANEEMMPRDAEDQGD